MTEPAQGVATSGEPRRARRPAKWLGSRRGRTVSSAVLLIACLMPVLGSSAGGAVLPSAVLPPNCPLATNPPPPLPGSDHYRVQVSGFLTESSPIVLTVGGLTLTIPSFSAVVCGLISIPEQTAVILPQNAIITVNGTTATLAQAILPISLAPDGPTTGSVAGQPAPNGGLNLIIQAPVTNTTSQLGVTCVTHLSVTLSTQPPGTPLVGPLGDATATLSILVSVPAGATSVSTTCPDYLAHQIDGLVGLPPTLAKGPNGQVLTANAELDICPNPMPVCPLPPRTAAASRIQRVQRPRR